MHEEIVVIHAIFKGEVQGVGFRATARHLARKFNVMGLACNLADGSVELYAQGKSSAVHQLIEELRGPHGPGEVVDVFSEEVVFQNQYTDFEIK